MEKLTSVVIVRRENNLEDVNDIVDDTLRCTECSGQEADRCGRCDGRLLFTFDNKRPSVVEQVANNHNPNNNATVSTQMSGNYDPPGAGKHSITSQFTDAGCHGYGTIAIALRHPLSCAPFGNFAVAVAGGTLLS